MALRAMTPALRRALACPCSPDRHEAIRADPARWRRETHRRALWTVSSRDEPTRALDLRDCPLCLSTLSRRVPVPGVLQRLAYALLKAADAVLRAFGAIGGAG